jgi:glycosyltransferase involved in cell wall biosynthesis
MGSENTYHSSFKAYQCCVLIPTYNNAQTLASVIDSVLKYTNDVVVVNDGSTDATADILKGYPNLHIVTQPANAGKGMALQTGFAYALSQGYKYAITIDSDGQHKAADLPTFIEKLKDNPRAIIIGARNMGQSDVPGTSSFGHKFSNFWFMVETGIKLPDTQSGYRLYPIEALKNYKWLTPKYEFEIEVMVRGAWGGIDVTWVPIDVYYPPKGERITHFRLFKDFTRISILNTFLVILAILYGRPAMLYWNLKKKSGRKFINDHLINSKESDHKLAGAVSLGIFFGIMPIWGYQWAGALLVAQLLKLNKVITYVFTNISIPPMIPLILFASVKTGSFFVGDADAAGAEFSTATITFESVKAHIEQYLIGSLVLGVIVAMLAWIFTYFMLKVFRNKKQATPNLLT